MTISKDNKDAIWSSLLVGLAWGLFFGFLSHFKGNADASPWAVGAVFDAMGFIVGLLITWDFDTSERAE